MFIEKTQTETYILTNLDTLDPVIVYVASPETGKGKIVIECFGKAWFAYWGDTRKQTLQAFFLSADNDYIIDKLLDGETTQFDFEEINDVASKRGFNLCVDNDVDVEIQEKQMAECFGQDWRMELPIRKTPEYEYLQRIVNVIKTAFRGPKA